MRLCNLISKKSIKLDLESEDKKGVIQEMVQLLVDSGQISESKEIVQAVLEREKKGTTGIGFGIAIPHGKSAHSPGLIAAFGRSSKGINFASLDNKPVHIVFLLISSEKSVGPHLKALAKISRLLKEKKFSRCLLEAGTEEEIMTLLSEYEDKLHAVWG